VFFIAENKRSVVWVRQLIVMEKNQWHFLYTDPQIPYPQRAQELINEALNYFRNQGFDFSRLTADGNDNIYALKSISDRNRIL
jgi:transglutaminase-like putative cysteine protease